MPILTDMTPGVPCAEETDGGLLDVSPFYAPHYHFGMLLGVDDFETALAYARGKSWLHNAWLHRDGVVWGLGVGAPEIEGRPGALSGEIAVDPGLGLDAAGHELALDVRQCVSVGAWFDQHRTDAGFAPTATATGFSFDAHVVIRWHACLSRPVPAMSQPCEGASVETAYSRSVETVEILLRPDHAPAPPAPPYPRLRLLFGLRDPATEGDAAVADADVVATRQSIGALAAADQPRAYLDAFRRFAALDEIDLRPAESEDGMTSLLYPDAGSPELTLADVSIVLERRDTGWALTSATIDNTVRSTLVATATIQELLCGPASAASAPAPPAPTPAPDAGGPRIDRATATHADRTVTFDTASGSVALHPASVDRPAIVVSAFDEGGAGWSDMDVGSVTANAAGTTVTVQLKESPPAGALVRLIARGTGDMPLLGANLLPLAGATDDPPAGANDGRDFVHIFRS